MFGHIGTVKKDSDGRLLLCTDYVNLLVLHDLGEVITLFSNHWPPCSGSMLDHLSSVWLNVAMCGLINWDEL